MAMSGGGVTITPIDDVEYRQAVIHSFVRSNDPRQYQIHFTDLISCLFCSFLRKIIPEKLDDEKYYDLLDWMRGLGFDTKITDRFAGKRRVVLGYAQGNVDMMFPSAKLGYPIPYELTSTPFLPKDIDNMVIKGERYRYKVEQLKLYMAGLCMSHGRLKIIQMVNRRIKDPADAKGKSVETGRATSGSRVPDRVRPQLQTREHTFDIRMTPLALARARNEIIERAASLDRALGTGTWWRIPRVYRPILNDAPCASKEGPCSSYAEAIKDPKTVHKAWRTWRGDM